ncbi:unnamed protein product [Allacma fusca]|uniref:Uncharacterized protein n=1 Tax=Allacma fusca TaxID=39272 RepID=A0A8J2KMR7_9HEXA|nr:unnamed protein product [Allacma fusca]
MHHGKQVIMSEADFNRMNWGKRPSRKINIFENSSRKNKILKDAGKEYLVCTGRDKGEMRGAKVPPTGGYKRTPHNPYKKMSSVRF